MYKVATPRAEKSQMYVRCTRFVENSKSVWASGRSSEGCIYFVFLLVLKTAAFFFFDATNRTLARARRTPHHNPLDKSFKCGERATKVRAC